MALTNLLTLNPTAAVVDLEVVDWGLIEYSQALDKQLDAIENLISLRETKPGFLFFCTHPAIVTLGSATKTEDIFAWQGPQMTVARGGKATYHGPSQLLVYPIVDLNLARRGRKRKEVVGFMRDLEKAIVNTLKNYGILSHGKSELAAMTPSSLENTGVWIGERKIASVGIGVKNWISYHGAAINIENDPKAFSGINPCGYKASTMISLEEALGSKVDRREFQALLQKELVKIL